MLKKGRFAILNLLCAMLLPCTVMPAAKAAPSSVPIIYRTSEAVKPGELLTVYGEYFEPKTEIRFKGTDTLCPIVYSDPLGHYVTCTVPLLQSPGIYKMYASNNVGPSSEFYVNAPLMQWIYNNNPWAEQSVKIVGRNLDDAEYGGTSSTLVRLVNGLDEYTATVTAVNPYAVDFIVPACPNQPYTIQISINGGATWFSYRGPQGFSTRTAGYDPLGLGVYWATEIIWSHHSALNFGATGDGATDDTAALQKGIDKIKVENSGGVLYLPKGAYRITRALSLPSGVSIQGESQTSTKIIYDGSAGASVIRTKDDGSTLGKVGVARLTINVLGANLPDIALKFGHTGSEVKYSDTRTATHIFVKDVTVDYLIDRAPTLGQRGIALSLVAKSNVVIQGNTFKTDEAAMASSYVNQYLDISDNTFEYSNSGVHLFANYSIALNNKIIGHPNYLQHKDRDRDMRGFTVRSQAYLYNNDIRNLGSIDDGRNDGEAILGEPADGGTKMYGAVESVATKVMTVTPVHSRDWDNSDHRWDKWHVLIVDGKGMGQLNEVTALMQSSRQITVKDNWRIAPDATSMFIVFLPLRQSVFYKNISTNNTKGFWFYGDNYDGVMAENKSINSEGLLINAVYVPANTFYISYFNRLERNVVTGYSPLSKVAGIGLRLSPEANGTPYVFGNLAYGTDIKGNSITGVLPAPSLPSKNYSEAPDINGIYAFRNTGYNQSRTLSEAVNIQNNSLNTLDNGITYDLNSKGLIRPGNTFSNVKQNENAIYRY
ncbi:glycosyl hydrolase family 28-related protein [Massilia antarctica]|uniref:glycosyl hydrolase family 28-related protein n=1 Tax=Massilia antarctica TaxID=2765360 RepID=UPI00226F92A2|nr:glycosyl hydrolase family 28-related protein [Massilia sp. H27-R4]MCY0915696.1 glycosyl hydrolase family 28-related protein [Massilia sp. H27-R4]